MSKLPQTERLLGIMAQLRNPEGGCPWDLEQNFASIASCTLEEAYEVVDAINKNDMPALREELGDLLLQVVFHSQMAGEAALFDFEAVAESIADKLIRRHPHVFGDADIKTAEAQTNLWEEIKAQERAAKGKADEPQSLLDDVPHALPALLRALKLQKRAAKVGFDWKSAEPIMAKLQEEIAELQVEIDAGATKEKLADELGDILFVCANIARHIGVNPEESLRGTNAKFERRFKYIESKLGKKMADASLEEMDALWDEAKRKERQGETA